MVQKLYNNNDLRLCNVCLKQNYTRIIAGSEFSQSLNFTHLAVRCAFYLQHLLSVRISLDVGESSIIIETCVCRAFATKSSRSISAIIVQVFARNLAQKTPRFRMSVQHADGTRKPKDIFDRSFLSDFNMRKRTKKGVDIAHHRINFINVA